MADILAPDVRSRMMSGIRAKNTKPEMIIRRGLHAMGFRFLLHDKRLPGKPDLVFPKYRAVIFVNGCFWHGHECSMFKWPKSREDFWRAKIAKNTSNDAANSEKIAEMGWRCLTIWECSIGRRIDLALPTLFEQCSNWLLSDRNYLEISCK